MTDLQRLVRRFRERPGLSRNRNFDELSKPEALRARRVVRWLEGLERELSAGGTIEVRQRGDGYVVEIRFPSLRARRETFVTAEELDLLHKGALAAKNRR